MPLRTAVAAADAAIDTLLRMTDAVVAIARAAAGGPSTPGAAPCCIRPSPRRRAGGRECPWADRRGLLRWVQSQRRSRWHHLRQRTIAGRPVICGAAVVFGRGRPAGPGAGHARGRHPGRRRPRSDRRDRRGRRPMVARLPVAGSASQPERAARLEAAMALAATAPPLLLHGDAVEVLPDAFARVPADALPVVTTTWALSDFPLESRLRFLRRLDEAAGRRRWRGCQWRGSEWRRRYRRLAIAAPPATASSAWRSSTPRRCTPRRSAAAGRGAAGWRGWPAPG